jgi:hypothetical protein
MSDTLRDLWNQLIDAKPTNADLYYVMEFVEPLRQEAAKRLLAQQPTNDDLCCVMEYVEPLRQEAWQRLLAQQPTNDDLRCVMEYVPSLRDQASQMFHPIDVRHNLLAQMRLVASS